MELYSVYLRDSISIRLEKAIGLRSRVALTVTVSAIILSFVKGDVFWSKW